MTAVATQTKIAKVAAAVARPTLACHGGGVRATMAALRNCLVLAPAISMSPRTRTATAVATQTVTAKEAALAARPTSACHGGGVRVMTAALSLCLVLALAMSMSLRTRMAMAVATQTKIARVAGLVPKPTSACHGDGAMALQAADPLDFASRLKDIH